jgi:hypothetical protein
VERKNDKKLAGDTEQPDVGGVARIEQIADLLINQNLVAKIERGRQVEGRLGR